MRRGRTPSAGESLCLSSVLPQLLCQPGTSALPQPAQDGRGVEIRISSAKTST